MGDQILRDDAIGPQGTFDVSTIRTLSGGAPDRPLMPGLGLLFDSTYADETPWPYETVVFQSGIKGHYHEAYKSESAARKGHRRIVAQIKDGTLPVGKGVDTIYGNPTLTPEEFEAGALQGK